jgi:hypothetical protein
MFWEGDTGAREVIQVVGGDRYQGRSQVYHTDCGPYTPY